MVLNYRFCCFFYRIISFKHHYSLQKLSELSLLFLLLLFIIIILFINSQYIYKKIIIIILCVKFYLEENNFNVYICKY